MGTSTLRAIRRVAFPQGQELGKTVRFQDCPDFAKRTGFDFAYRFLPLRKAHRRGKAMAKEDLTMAQTFAFQIIALVAKMQEDMNENRE